MTTAFESTQPGQRDGWVETYNGRLAREIVEKVAIAAGRTWVVTRADALRPGDIVRLANPPVAVVKSITIPDDASPSDWSVLTIQLDTQAWSRMCGDEMDSGAVIIRRAFEAIEIWVSRPE